MARTKTFTLDDKRALLLVLEELNSRNVSLPEETAGVLKKKNLVWPVDENGYFIKKDGTLYNATEAQAGFIATDSRFSLYYGGRGSGKSCAGGQKALRKIMDGENGAVINPLFSDFKDSTWKEFSILNFES